MFYRLKKLEFERYTQGLQSKSDEFAEVRRRKKERFEEGLKDDEREIKKRKREV